MDIIQLAKDAYYGKNNVLLDAILVANGYVENGRFYPANSIDLNECIATVATMSDEEIAE